MQKKRSVGVTMVALIMLIISIFYITGNSFLLTVCFMPEDVKALFLSEVQTPEKQIFQRSMKLLIEYLILFVLGIGVLKLNNLMRKITIFYSAFGLVALVLAVILFKKAYSIPQTIIYILFNSFLIFFFTRTKVKEMFQ